MADHSYLLSRENTIQYLSDQLYKGYLTLFLGAGISAGIGLPKWADLINNLWLEYNKAMIKDYQSDSFIPVVSEGDSADRLQEEADKIIRKVGNIEKFHDYLEIALYSGKIDFDNIGTVIHHDLILALGALMIGSKRGHVNNIVTLNFDNILEWYLNIYGYIANVIYNLPALEGNEDVRIYHPHGYIPNSKIDTNTRRSDFSILGLNSINKRLGTTGDPWFEKTRHILRAGVCLFIGMSKETFKDRALAPLINTVGEEVGKTRPLGFWFLKSSDLDENTRDEFLSSNIVPIEIVNYEEIPKFLFDICKESAKKVF